MADWGSLAPPLVDNTDIYAPKPTWQDELKKQLKSYVGNVVGLPLGLTSGSTVSETGKELTALRDKLPDLSDAENSVIQSSARLMHGDEAAKKLAKSDLSSPVSTFGSLATGAVAGLPQSVQDFAATPGRVLRQEQAPDDQAQNINFLMNMVGGGGMTHAAFGAGERALGVNTIGIAKPKLVPALRRGDEILTGGANHGEVAMKHDHFPTSPDDSGFSIDGKFYPRDTALDIVKAQEPGTAENLTKARMGRLEANDLRRAREVSEGTYPTSPPLKGMPLQADVPGFGSLAVGPNATARDAAESYMKSRGMPYNPERNYVPVDPERAARVAQEFEKMPHAPHDPEVAKSYDALINETKAQFDAMPKDLKIEFIKPGMEDPYAASPRLVQKDIAENNHMWVYPTESGFGDVVQTKVAGKAQDLSKSKVGDSPMLQDSGVEIDGLKLKNNDLFRIVHDYFGHHKEGVGFRATGEDNAFRQHRSMFSPAAQRALTTETRGQNSWLNYGPHGAKNRTAKTEDTVFADQKVGLMPPWTTLYANSKQAAPLSLAAGAANRKPLVVAGRMSDGTVVYGKPGELHHNLPRVSEIDDFGFAQPDGNFMSRAEASAWVAQNQPAAAKPGGKSLEAGGYKRRLKDAGLFANSKQAAPLSLASGLTPREAKWVEKGMTPEQAQIMSVASEQSPKKEFRSENVPFNFPGIAQGDTRISTRVPQQTTPAGGTRNWVPDAHNEHLAVDTKTMSTMPSFEHNIGLLSDYPGFKKLAGMPAKDAADQYINQTVGNTLHLYSRLPGEVVDRSPKWYEGAQRVSDAFSQKWGVARHKVSAAIAALSPQKDWFQNASLAQRVGDIMFGDAATKPATKEMIDWAKTANKSNSDELLFNKPEDQALIKEITGKRFDELSNDQQRSMWVRAYDEAHNKRNYREITPEGEIGPWAIGVDGQTKISWGSMNEIEKAVRALRAGDDPREISHILSDTHKVRSFYNNIENPHDARFGDATVDTHQVGGSQLRSVSQRDPAVLHNFALSPMAKNRPAGFRATASAGSLDTGIHGTYPLLNDTLRQAGHILGVVPRKVQSPTWEGIRLRFPREGKGKGFDPDKVWNAYDHGEITLDQARDLIVPEGSIPLPSYAKPGYQSMDPRLRSTYVNPASAAPLGLIPASQDRR